MCAEIIERVEAQIVDLPLKRVHKFSAASINTKEYLLVRIYTASGVMGIGEATTPGGPWWAGEAIESIKVIIEKYFEPCLLGEDALNLNHLMAKLDRVATGNTFAKAAIEMSLLDVKGRALGVPVYQLLGGLFRESASICWPLAMGDVAADVEEAEAILGARIAGDFKVKMGYKSPVEDVEYLAGLCDALCDRASVSGDLNGAWDEPQARELLPALERNGMHLIEQPLPSWNLDGMARIREVTRMPFLADESARTVQDVLRLITIGASDAVSLKPLKSGGLLACQKIAAIAEAAGVSCYAGTFLESSIGTASMMHLVAATSNVSYGNELVGPIWLADDLVQEPIEYRDNQVWVKHTPGLGVELDEEKVTRYARN